MLFDFVILACSFIELSHYALRNTKQPHGESQSISPQLTYKRKNKKLHDGETCGHHLNLVIKVNMTSDEENGYHVSPNAMY